MLLVKKAHLMKAWGFFSTQPVRMKVMEYHKIKPEDDSNETVDTATVVDNTSFSVDIADVDNLLAIVVGGTDDV